MKLKQLQSLLNEVSQTLTLSLRVLDLISSIVVPRLEQVEYGKDLSVIWHKGLANELSTDDQLLQYLQHARDDLRVSRVQGSLDRNDQLGDGGKNLLLTVLEQIVAALDGQKVVRFVFLSQSIEEDREVVMVVELVDVNLPVNFVSGSLVSQSDGQISSIVESSELSVRDLSSGESTSPWRLRYFGLLSSGKRAGGATGTTLGKAEGRELLWPLVITYCVSTCLLLRSTCHLLPIAWELSEHGTRWPALILLFDGILFGSTKVW